MSGLVLIVGALLGAAGGYEMVAGSGDILSERGWSAFIAGSVLVAGGVTTMALGLAVRAVDRLRGAILRQQPATAAAPSERIEPGPAPTAPPPIPAPAPEPDLGHEPVLERAPTAPELAAAPIEHALAHEPYSAAAGETSPAQPLGPEPDDEPPAPVEPEPRHDDWLDHGFAEPERDLAVRHEPAAATVAVAPLPHPEPVVAEPAPFATPEPPPAEPRPEATVAGEEPSAEVPAHEHDWPAPHDDAAAREAAADRAIVSAREESTPHASAVIGRYESEGTSYVMYADGSIDAQSEAGVYRFASMSELKAFIES